MLMMIFVSLYYLVIYYIFFISHKDFGPPFWSSFCTNLQGNSEAGSNKTSRQVDSSGRHSTSS